MPTEAERADGAAVLALQEQIADLRDAQRTILERIEALDSMLAEMARDLAVLNARLLGQFPIDPQIVAEHLNLTPAQSRVAVALAEGSSVRNIVEATGRSEQTIRYYVREIFRRLNISSQTDLVRLVLLLPYGSAMRSRPDATMHRGSDHSPGR